MNNFFVWILERFHIAKRENIIHIKDMMVLGMADMVESRDNNTGGHIKRTSSVVKVFSARLKKHCDVLGIRDVIKKHFPMTKRLLSLRNPWANILIRNLEESFRNARFLPADESR